MDASDLAKDLWRLEDPSGFLMMCEGKHRDADADEAVAMFMAMLVLREE